MKPDDQPADANRQLRVEVLVGNRYTEPVTFGINFQKRVKVVAEAVQTQSRRQATDVKVSSSLVVKAGGPTFRTLKERYENRR